MIVFMIRGAKIHKNHELTVSGTPNPCSGLKPCKGLGRR
jgi:hypothetical protein